jgi:hypothetical protein
LIAVIDTSVLTFLFDEHSPIPIDESTGAVVTKVKIRLEYLIFRLAQDKVKIIVPTPTLAEILVNAGTAGPDG